MAAKYIESHLEQSPSHPHLGHLPQRVGQVCHNKGSSMPASQQKTRCKLPSNPINMEARLGLKGKFLPASHIHNDGQKNVHCTLYTYETSSLPSILPIHTQNRNPSHNACRSHDYTLRRERLVYRSVGMAWTFLQSSLLIEHQPP